MIRERRGRDVEAWAIDLVSLWIFVWVTLALFLVSLAGHWWLAWHAFQDEQLLHNAPAEFVGFLVEVGRDTLENWQSEFLQLMWQIAGLAILFHVRSPQSRENEARLEEKVDLILRKMDPATQSEIERLDAEYYR